MQDSLFLLPFFSKKVRQKPHLLHIFKFLNHISPNVWFQSWKATNVPWVIEEKDLKSCERKEKPKYSRVSAISQWLLWRKSWKEKRKKVKIFAYIFAFWGFYERFWLWSRDIQFWRTLVFLAPACVKCLGWAFRLWKAGGQEDVQKKGKEKREKRK